MQLLTTYGAKQDSQKQKSISFQEIKPYKADNKYFLLCGASSYISPEIENANDFSLFLLEKANVATVTGDAFGAPNCIRMSYAASEIQLREAIKRIKKALS